ncbi:hypothetical protein P5673_024852 [Acropora cervicornis]|uniref:Uncharacterized protein n=1 Tax=Acropora cervicornis TaxID=6130 RepID=A0AAD9Q3A5_ACRCE|nr:hypothetical protein P5673_024852 [Acropora cervicornis]
MKPEALRFSLEGGEGNIGKLHHIQNLLDFFKKWNTIAEINTTIQSLKCNGPLENAHNLLKKVTTVFIQTCFKKLNLRTICLKHNKTHHKIKQNTVVLEKNSHQGLKVVAWKKLMHFDL